MRSFTATINGGSISYIKEQQQSTHSLNLKIQKLMKPKSLTNHQGPNFSNPEKESFSFGT